jgi:hypothetical protein
MLWARWCCRFKLSEQAHDQRVVKRQQMKEDEAQIQRGLTPKGNYESQIVCK